MKSNKGISLIILILIIALLAIGVIVGVVMVINGGKNDIENPKENNNVAINVDEEPDSTTDEEDDDSSEWERYILSLKPTHTTTKDYPFKDFKNWSVHQSIDDISHLDDGYYEFSPSKEYKEAYGLGILNNERVKGSWNDIKNLPVVYINVYSTERKLNVRSGDKWIVEYEFETDLPEGTTIEQAVEQGYWRYTALSSHLGLDIEEFLDKDDIDYNKTDIENLIDIWGQPTEVFYIEYGYFTQFLLLYETKDVTIELGVSAGAEGNADMITSLVVCGKKAQTINPEIGYERLP